jgi:F1F0 ATPase subunit 2
MSLAAALSVALMSGVVLGAVFFGGLWLTVRRGMRTASPALWFSVSSLLRNAGASAGFYVVSQGEWRRLLACLVGFFLARTASLRLSRVPVPSAANRGSR